MKIAFWIITGLASAFMTFSAVPDITVSEDAILIFKHLGYPVYLLTLLGALKLTASVVLLVPVSNKIKEWAYAGLTFDLVGAFYSHMSVGDSFATAVFALIGLLLVIGSYAAHHARLRNQS